MPPELNRVQEMFEDFNRLRSDRGNFESHWKEIAERVIPAHRQLFTAFGATKTKGERRTEFIFDSTPMLALGKFASILDSLLTPRNQTWHKLKASDPELNKIREVKLWFADTTRRLFKHRYAPKANFSSQNQKVFKSLGAYGTASMFIDPLDGGRDGELGLRYKNIHLGETFFRENHQGIIDTVYRHFPLTAKKAIEKWGDRVPDAVKNSKDPSREFFFLHRVEPNLNRDPSRLDFRGMLFSSMIASEEGKVLLEEGGFRSFPYAAPRYDQHSGETYGRSPAMDALPSIKTLNEEKKTVLKQGHRTVDPVLLAHDDGVIDQFSLRPGALNFGGVSAEGKTLVQTLPVGRVDIGKDLMDDERETINDFFLVTLFQILTDTPTMTATEVIERTKEKGILLAPTVGRQQSEYLGPLIERELDVLSQQRLLAPMPGVLLEAQGDYTVEYDSPLSRAQRAEEAGGLMRSVETALTIVNTTKDPAPLDHFNWDVVIPEISAIHGVPPKWLRSAQEIQAIREGRSQQQQTQEAAQLAPGAAAMTKAIAVASK